MMSPQPKKRSRKARSGQSPVVPIKIQDGRFQIAGLGVWHAYWRDPYHLLLSIPWLGFLSVIAVSYLAINTLFAIAYLAGGDCIENARPGSFLDHFFFSVQTLASIGYGAMYPKTIYANSVVTVEAMVGLIGVAVSTGLAFARFSRPTARIVFSRPAIIAPHNGIPTLMFRTANQRRNLILEAQIQVYLMRDEISQEGQPMRRIYDLKLLRHRSPSFTLSWTVMHPIDKNSPLYGVTPESLFQTQTTIVISLSGIDESVAQVIHSRHVYAAQDLFWNHRFVDIIHNTLNGDRYIDYNDFHQVLPIEEGTLALGREGEGETR
jgi:inward rectifier potassium channel